MEQTAERTARYIGSCKTCRRVIVTTGSGRGFKTQFCCKGHVKLIPVKGTERPEQKCDARCTNARGPKCDCSCAGHNHGAGWAA